MKKILIILFLSISIQKISAQNEMIVDMPYNGNTHYENSKFINSVSELPNIIQMNLNGFLQRIFGSKKDSISFSHGQIIDLDLFFKNDSLSYNRQWIVPKYDLNFIIQDNSIGIKRYYLQIKFDEYGQILDFNWPREAYSGILNFKPCSDIKAHAISYAKSKGYNTDNYLIGFGFNNKTDKLCWIFKFKGV